MAELFNSGRVVDYILFLMLLEALGMAWWRRRSGKGLKLNELLASLGAGAALLLALKSALVRAPWLHVACWLMVALAAHATDLTLRSIHKRAI